MLDMCFRIPLFLGGSCFVTAFISRVSCSMFQSTPNVFSTGRLSDQNEMVEEYKEYSRFNAFDIVKDLCFRLSFQQIPIQVFSFTVTI